MTTIVSVAQRRQNCGVSEYAAALERELEPLGVQFIATTLHKAAKLIDPGSIDGVLVHQEHSEGIRSFEMTSLPRLVRRCRNYGIPIIVVVHTVYDKNSLRKAPILGPLVLLYQRVILGWLSLRTSLVVLSRSGEEFLASRGIRASYVPHGIPGGAASVAACRVPTHRLRVGVVGHPYGFKRFDLAARAYAKLPGEVRNGTEFWVIGGEHNRDPVAFEAMMLALTDVPKEYIHVTGALDKASFLAALYGLDIALFPYDRRMQGSSALANAVAAGIPLLVSSSPAFDDIVNCRGAERIQNWVDDGAQFLLALINDETRRRKMHENALVLADKQSLRNTAHSILATLQHEARSS